ncbi:MAG: DUF2019 domain-containing protein [Roseiarcus sp.]
MSKTDYSSLSIDDLLKHFENACLEQYDTYITDDLDTFKRNFQELVAIRDELEERGPEARRSLLRLLNHDNRQVRLQAAKVVYPVARPEATKCLQALAAARFPDDQCFDARMTLHRLEEVPDCLDH